MTCTFIDLSLRSDKDLYHYMACKTEAPKSRTVKIKVYAHIKRKVNINVLKELCQCIEKKDIAEINFIFAYRLWKP